MICKLCNLPVVTCTVSDCDYKNECKLFSGEILGQRVKYGRRKINKTGTKN